VHDAFPSFFGVKNAENPIVNRRVRISQFGKWVLNADFLLFQVLSYDFFAFFTQWRLSILATAASASATDIKRVGYAFVPLIHDVSAFPLEEGFIIAEAFNKC
jgi:hypothetical protein